MTPDSPIKLVSELLDLPLFDSEEKYCGIVDDVEMSGGPGKALKLKALLVGPGAYRGPHAALGDGGWSSCSPAIVLPECRWTRCARSPAPCASSAPAAISDCTRARTAAAKWLPRRGAL